MTLSTLKKIHQVWSRYDLKEISDIKRISGGIINETYQITNKKNNVYILQKLHRIFNWNLMADIKTIAEHLESKGWECPRLLKSNEEKFFASLDSEIWRTYEYIPGNDFSSISISKEFYFEIGEILGLLHRDLVLLQYEPLHKIEGFHNKDFYFEKATKIERNIYPVELQSIWEELYESLEKYSLALKGHQQLIHGDPRVENILFSPKGNPFTFIDYDTFMQGSIYIDIGDCLRSLMFLEDGATLSYRFQQFIFGYSLANPEARIQNIQVLSGLKYVILELTLRFLIDSVEQNYFFWNPKLYKTASEHNEDRARQHWNLFNKISQEL